MQPDSTNRTENAPENGKIIVNELCAKWGNSQNRISLPSTDDLLSQVQTRYGLNKEQALRDVDALLKGRAF